MESKRGKKNNKSKLFHGQTLGVRLGLPSASYVGVNVPLVVSILEAHGKWVKLEKQGRGGDQERFQRRTSQFRWEDFKNWRKEKRRWAIQETE